MKPLAIKANLTIRELAEETLIYDNERHKMHCLNRTSALVWKHCDGRHGVAALAAILSRELGLSAGDADAGTRLALEQLSRRHLLQEAVAPAAGEERVTRRAALRKIAKAAAVVLPLVMTLKSPSVARASGTYTGCAASGCPDGQECIRLESGPHGSYHDGFCAPKEAAAKAAGVCVGPAGTPCSAGQKCCGNAGAVYNCPNGGTC